MKGRGLVRFFLFSTSLLAFFFFRFRYDPEAIRRLRVNESNSAFALLTGRYSVSPLLQLVTVDSEIRVLRANASFIRPCGDEDIDTANIPPIWTVRPDMTVAGESKHENASTAENFSATSNARRFVAPPSFCALLTGTLHGLLSQVSMDLPIREKRDDDISAEEVADDDLRALFSVGVAQDCLARLTGLSASARRAFSSISDIQAKSTPPPQQVRRRGWAHGSQAYTAHGMLSLRPPTSTFISVCTSV
ncbi:hypothetical protein B0J12DRAFT_703088 [Macrophomina phaseolina]|uniref:Transmembrane protein n=1 Tax=Macrophomina phaseolina TaxID=35725 RepID=A0ABQ8FZY6_9PEZI|nr:hypothetical protein B0J12DRAFT_703088 [Macrophomina phaseolina]